jgi:Na+-translocating ferredoxin:NAD+ oxidoreductase subunit C
LNKKKEYKKVYKNGFNLIETYPVKFPETVVLVKYDGPVDSFNFSFPNRKVEHVIVSLCPTEPWALPNWAILKNKAPDFLKKLETVRAEYFPDSHCHVVVNCQETSLINEFSQYKSQTDWLHVHTLDPIYPNDAPVLIVKKIVGLDIAYGQNTTDIGVIILDPQSVIGIFENYIQENKIDTRLVPVSGTGLKENKILRVKLGTPIQKLLETNIKKDIKFSVFINGPMNGLEVKGLTQKIDWSTKNIVVLEEKDYKTLFPYMRVNELVFTTSLMGELRRCVYCNYCDDICPVDLEPALYWHCYIRGEKQKARLYALEKCIECGLCSFICPSKLELLQVIKECKSLK